ncbi:MAG: hypothetical protein AAGA46_11060 [Cyanobacteria bacterium P01_F01_bin.13]
MVVKQILAWQIPENVPERPAELALGAVVHLTIEFDGHGYRLLAVELNGDYTLSAWHPSLKVAEQSAAQLFGPRSKDWETVGMS